MKERLLTQFQNKYDRQGWQRTLLEVFGVREINPDPVLIDETDKAISYEIGRHVTADGYEVGVFEYAMKPGQRVDKSRAGLRSLVSRLVRYHVDAALVVFHDEKHWRLSFICDLKDEKTAPKRFTYVFGYSDQSYRTPLERFTTLADAEPTFANIYDAFSVERLDKDFFAGYKDHYKMFCGYMPDAKEYRDFVKRMMGRIVFLYFLQKKGWLGEDRNFLANLLERSRAKFQDTFLSGVLGLLFFETLNKQRSGDLVDPILGEGITIPYLNGGLFERGELDRDGVDFPYECFEKFFRFLSSYNFTVDENGTDDAEVGVDPEMLGHIFENLLEDNKDKGAYYTPKEVVQYMCRGALEDYLKERTDSSLHDNIHLMIHGGQYKWLKECPAAKEIIGYVRDVKVCDPAIGSGVFPMMMLAELFAIRRAMYDVFDSEYPITPYLLKKDIIKNNLYGVDLDQGAVEIARLRFWLALVVEDDQKRPLPNLDYKIMQGNSLIESFMGRDLSFYYDKGETILHADRAKGKQGLVAEYFGESVKERKKELRNCIECRVREHICYCCMNSARYKSELDEIDPTNRPFFLWNTYFNHILWSERNGFDIVIGNPPYGATVDARDKRQLRREFRTARTGFRNKVWTKGSQDTYALFIEQGYNLLATGGVLSYIVPMSVTSSDSMSAVQTLLLNNCREIRISSYSDSPKPVFENADIKTSIISLVKTKTRCEAVYMTKTHRRKGDTTLNELLASQEFIEAGDYILRGRFPKIGSQIEKNILAKIGVSTSSLGNFIQDLGHGGLPIYYRFSGGRYFNVVTNYSTGSTAEKSIYINPHIRNLVGAILSSNLYHWYYDVYSDQRNFKRYEIESFPFPVENFSEELIAKISKLYEDYLADIEGNSILRKTKRKSISEFREYKISKSKHLIDRLDDLICPAYGLTPDETEFIKNYEVEFRVQDVK